MCRKILGENRLMRPTMKRGVEITSIDLCLAEQHTPHACLEDVDREEHRRSGDVINLMEELIQRK